MIFRLEGVSYTYPNGTKALSGLDLDVEKGEFLAVTGDNGSGKTTLLWILDGLLFPQEGRVLFEGKELRESDLEKGDFAWEFRRRVGMVFQEPDVQLFCSTVREDIAFGPRKLGLGNLQKRVEEASRRAGVEHLLDRPPHALSWGQKKRAALATLLAGDYDVLLLDEPSPGLDAGGRRMLTDFLKEARSSGRTVILAAHDDRDLLALADRELRL